MTPDRDDRDGLNPPSDDPIDRAVRDALSVEGAESKSPAARVLAHIGVRAPHVVRDQHLSARLRVLSAAAAVVLLVVSLRRGPDSGAGIVDLASAPSGAQLLAVVDDDDLEGRATADDVLAELFDVEVPE